MTDEHKFLFSLAIFGQRTLSDTPEVFTAFDNTTISSFDVLRGTNDGEGHSFNESTGQVSTLVIDFNGRSVDANSLGSNNFADLMVTCEKSAQESPTSTNKSNLPSV